MIITGIDISASEIRHLTSPLREAISSTDVRKVLEFGCGRISLADELLEYTVYLACTDSSGHIPEKLHEMAAAGKVFLISDSELDEDCYFGRFHLIYTVFGFHDLPHLVDEIMRLRRLLIKGGKMLIIDSPADNFYEECIKQMKRCGFPDIHAETFVNNGKPAFMITAEK